MRARRFCDAVHGQPHVSPLSPCGTRTRLTFLPFPTNQLEEFTAPYYLLTDAGVAITLASPAGGRPPLDPGSLAAGAATASTRRFDADAAAQAAFAATTPLAEVRAGDFDAVFYPGGHGGLWDLAGNPASIALIDAFAAAGKPVAAVCHGPAVLVGASKPDGTPLVAGLDVAAFTNAEEAAVQLTAVVPFLLHDKLASLGAVMVSGPDWAPLAVTATGGGVTLVTGQNPASSEAVAQGLLKVLG